MSKNLLQDMIKVKHLSREMSALPDSALDAMETQPQVSQNRRRNRPRYKLWLVAIISFIFFLFSLSYMFVKVEVQVNPKIKDVLLNQNLLASKDGGGEALSFDLIVISGEEEKIIKTTEEKDVSKKAEGVVLIYNTFSSATQRLDIDTRLEGSNGKIYKTKKQIIVPGMKGSVPGSIEVGIYGAGAGEEYNSGPLDFTIFGFKGTPKYSKFYARSKGEINGGFVGKAPIISEEQKIKTINELKTTLQTKLFKKATDQIPSGFILFKDAIFLNIDDDNVDLTAAQDNILPIKLKGTLYGLLFNEGRLTKKIAEENINEYDGSLVFLSNIRNLIFSLPTGQAGLSNKENISFANNISEVKNINFNLSGATKIVWKLDEKKLITDLLGKSKKDFKQILSQYPNIDSADLSISPFWKMSFPDKSKDIKVIVNYPK